MKLLGRALAAGALLALVSGGAGATIQGPWNLYYQSGGAFQAPVAIQDAQDSSGPHQNQPAESSSGWFVAYCVDRQSDTGVPQWKQIYYSNDPVNDFVSSNNNPGNKQSNYSANPPWWTQDGAEDKWLKVSWAASFGQTTDVSGAEATGVQAAIFNILGVGLASDLTTLGSDGSKGTALWWYTQVLDTVDRASVWATAQGKGQAYLLDRYHDSWGYPGQGLVVGYGVAKAGQTPEASSLLLLLPGLLPLGLLARKRSKA